MASPPLSAAVGRVALDGAAAQTPEYGSRELVVLYGSVHTCDPGPTGAGDMDLAHAPKAPC